jgi:hypothetical protein
MRESRVYVCNWEKLDKSGYRGVVQRPKLEVEADSLDEIVQELTEQIAAATGDCEPVIEFEPPIAAGGKADWFRDQIVSAGPTSHFQVENFDNIVEDGYCKHCKYPQGGRTAEEISVESMWPGDASFSWDSRAEGLRVLLISEQLLAAFSKSDRSAFDVRAVRLPAGKRKRFLEVLPKQFVPEIAVKSLEATGWHCEVCGQIVFSHGRELGWGVAAISRERLPNYSVFFVGTSTNYRLCMKSVVWDRLKPILRKASMSSELVAVVNPDQVAKRVALPEIEEVRRRNAER